MTSTQQKKIARTSSTEDRISSLPDALISHILSFLPTKLAVATSILSKRWTSPWKSVLTLYIDDEMFKEDFDSFRQFMHSVIFMRDPTLPIRAIRCDIYKNMDPLDFNRFVQAVAQRGLEIFELESLDFSYTLGTIPGLLRVLNCKTLVVLKLGFVDVHEVPNLVDLPLLKTLDLNETQFKCSFVHFMNLLRGCPVLEDLFTNQILLPHIPNDFVEVEESKAFSKLARADINVSRTCEENFLFRRLYNVKFLRAILRSNCLYQLPPTFHNLTHMELVLSFYYSPIHYAPIYYSRRLNWELVIQVLQHCPNLQNLTIDEEYMNINPTGDGDWAEPETIPECLSSQLRKCSLQGFCGMECELHFAEYILLNSKLLCTMTIKTDRDSRLDSDEKLQLLGKLSSYPRGSVTCKLLFD